LKIEIIVGFSGPEPESIYGLSTITHHGTIERYANQSGCLAEDRAQSSATHLEGAVEPHFNCLVLTTDLPWVGATEPVVWDFVLPAVLNCLLKNTVFVAKAITHRWDFHRSHRIEEASSQTSQPSIAQPRVGLLLQQFVPIELLFLDDFPGDVIKKKVRDIVSQRTTDEKFHRKVVNALWVRAFIGLLGLNPSLRKDITHRMSDCFQTLASADLSRFQDVIKYEVAFVERIVRPGELDRAAAVTF